MRFSFPSLLLLCTTSAAASVGAAQELHLNAVLESTVPSDPADGDIPPFCPFQPFALAETGILISPGELDLSPYVGRIVHLAAIDQTGGCPGKILQVTAVSDATATLEACGVPRPGCDMRLRVGPPATGQGFLAASFGEQGFLNLGDPLGVLFLGAPILLLGPTGPGGVLDLTVPPGAPIGLPIQLQGLHVEAGRGAAALSNPLQLELVFGPACIDPTGCGF
jgi:hypothetical protein